MDLDLTGYIITFLSGVGALFVFLQIRTMYRARIEAVRKKEMAIQLHKLRDTNELLTSAKKLPFSKALFTCLYHRLLETLTTLCDLEPENTKLASRTEYVRDKIKLIESSTSSAAKNNFQIPANEVEAIGLLKVVKKLRVVIRTGHAKGQINDHSLVNENSRLENYQTRIIIGNLIKRTNYAIEKDQTVIANELLRKGLNYLNSRAGTHSMDTIVELVEELEKLKRKLTDEDQFQDLISVSDDDIQQPDSPGMASDSVS